MSKRQKSLFAADFSAVAKRQKLLFASITLQQKSTNFLSEFVSKSKICSRNSRISTFDCRYNDYRMSKRQKSLFAADFSAVAKSQKLLFASISLQQKSTNFLSEFVSKSKICSRNSRISTFDCRYNLYSEQFFENRRKNEGY